jgi:hypothetical protein
LSPLPPDSATAPSGSPGYTVSSEEGKFTRPVTGHPSRPTTAGCPTDGSEFPYNVIAISVWLLYHTRLDRRCRDWRRWS